jgi:HPt (histidine-containing phosphotransfer) domain-containing protein
MNFSQMAETIGLSVDEFMEIAESFVTATQTDLLQLRAGIHNDEYEQVCAAAHSIKGAALTFGFVAMHAAALSVEVNVKENRAEMLPEAIDLVERELHNIANSLQHRICT